jgi:hypothetical protein
MVIDPIRTKMEDQELHPQAVAQYAKRLTDAEMEYQSKMATEKALYELGKLTSQMDGEKSMKLAVQKVMKEYMGQFKMEDEEMERIYKTPVDLLETQIELMVDQNESFDGMKVKTKKLDRITMYKMMIYMEMMRERIKVREREISVLKVSNEQLDLDISNYIQEIEDLEKVIADPVLYSPLKEELEIKNKTIDSRNQLILKQNLQIAHWEEKYRHDFIVFSLTMIILFVYMVSVNDHGVDNTNRIIIYLLGYLLQLTFWLAHQVGVLGWHLGTVIFQTLLSIPFIFIG